MDAYELPRLIRQIVREELAPSLMGKSVSTQSALRATVQRFSGENPIANARILSPYGLASRPKAGTQGLVAPVAGDPSHLNLLTCFDEARPTMAEGEAILYGADGQVVYMQNGGNVRIGSKAAAAPAVLGDVLKDLMTGILEDFIATAQMGYDSFALPVYLDPSIMEDFIQRKLEQLDTPGTNILAQKIFVERGA